MGLPKKKGSSSNHQGRLLKFTMHVHCSIQTVFKIAPTLSPQSSAVQSRTSTWKEEHVAWGDASTEARNGDSGISNINGNRNGTWVKVNNWPFQRTRTLSRILHVCQTWEKRDISIATGGANNPNVLYPATISRQNWPFLNFCLHQGAAFLSNTPQRHPGTPPNHQTTNTTNTTNTTAKPLQRPLQQRGATLKCKTRIE